MYICQQLNNHWTVFFFFFFLFGLDIFKSSLFASGYQVNVLEYSHLSLSLYLSVSVSLLKSVYLLLFVFLCIPMFISILFLDPFIDLFVIHQLFFMFLYPLVYDTLFIFPLLHCHLFCSFYILLCIDLIVSLTLFSYPFYLYLSRYPSICMIFY